MAQNPDDPEDGEEKPRATDLFPYDELSTGATSALLQHARRVTGLQDDDDDDEPKLAHDPTLKPTTGRFLALKAAADSARVARASTPRREGPRPAPPPGPAARPPMPQAPPPGPRPSLGGRPQGPAAMRSEIRNRLRNDAAVAPPPGPGVRPSRPAKPPLAAEDTFVKKKIRQAENNLPDWEFDGDDDDLV